MVDPPPQAAGTARARIREAVFAAGRFGKRSTELILRAGPAVRIGIASAAAMTVTMCSYWAQSSVQPPVQMLLPDFAQQQTTLKSDRLDAYAREERASSVLSEPTKFEIATSTAWPFSDRINAGVQIGPNGERTYGIRIAVPVGTPVRAAADGVVDFAGNAQDGYGNKIVVKHGTIRTVYGHISDVLVTPKAKVRKGQVIAKSGQSGFATSPRLYLGVLGADPGTDPLAYFAKAGTIDRCATGIIPCPIERKPPPPKPSVVAPLREAHPVPPSDIPHPGSRQRPSTL